ncbi:MAG TPA: NAD(P)/FAD-dependent oxidoreductase [Kofleriaceae bacterium]|jgi:2-polyprenyl-6-methoxyphenol hydroxylase-like FAD-dependent oxidoreductase|nr:NAD(P)/FAD-dependent oxidoreductase [Kofleriaceae bacterium]
MSRVGVVGCGTAGAAAALLLARAGHEVTVLERVAEPRPVGAGIIVQPTGQAVLARLGLLEQIAARSSPIDRLFLRTSGGRTLVDLSYAELDQTWRGLGVHRGVLFAALHDAVTREPRIALHTGVTVRSLRELTTFELVIVADGTLSQLRDEHARRDVAYPWGALWFVAEDRDRVFGRELYQVATGARRLYGMLPTGLGPIGDAPIISMFWSLPARELDAFRRGDGFAAWKADVLAHDPRAEAVLAKLESPAQLTFARYRDVTMRPWHDRGVVYIGDAAHATSPQLGQGANLALVDAATLADSLASTRSIDHALAAYSRARKRHVDHYQLMTRLLTPLFQSDSRALGLLRDLAFPLANAVGPLRREMVRTMCGVSRGFLRRALPVSLSP